MDTEKTKKCSDARIKATRKYEAKTYWSPTIHLPKEYKEQIQATGQSTNSFIREAIEEKLNRI
jgi:predicted DNA-binding protein